MLSVVSMSDRVGLILRDAFAQMLWERPNLFADVRGSKRA